MLTLALGEDVGVEVFLCVRAARRDITQLAAVDGRQGVDRQRQRGLRERCLHVGEVETVGVFPVQLKYLIPSV